MYSRGFTYGRTSGVACLPTITRNKISPRPSHPSETQWCPKNHFAYQGIGLHPSHITAAEDGGENKQDPDLVPGFRRVKTNNPFASPSLRFITFDQAQHDLGVENGEALERERYSDQIARFLPIQSASQRKQQSSQISAYAKHKEDKLFINKLLKDRGLSSQDWRIALSDLLKHTACETATEPRKADSLNDESSLVHTFGSQNRNLCDSNADQNPVRIVASRSRNYKSYRLARNITPPVVWSEANLAAYVEALAESQRTQIQVAFAERPQQSGWTNIEDIVTAFETIFYSTASQKYLSIEACNTALRFYYDYSMMTKARALYIRMEDLKMQIPTETFNILLRGSASQRDLHNFTFLLNNMTRRGFKPNEVTWTLFLQVIDCSKVRAIIIRKMAEMNMLDKIGIRRVAAAHMIHYEIGYHLDNGNDHHSFLDYMNSKYGIGWLSTSAGNRLLNEVAKRKSTADSLSLLYEMKHEGFMPDDISLNTLLRHCLAGNQHDLAIETLNVFEQLYRLHPGPAAYETLFLQAWRNCLLNVSAVIWRSACIYGAVSAKIRSLIFQSLLSYTPALDERVPLEDTNSNCSRSAKIKRFAGRFAIGLDGRRAAALSQAMGTIESDPQRRTLKWAQILMDGSLSFARKCVLQSSLSQLLRQALTNDKTWASEGLYKKGDWRELFPRSIALRVRLDVRHLRRQSRSFTRREQLLRGTIYRKLWQSNRHVQKFRSRQSGSTKSTLTSRLSSIWRKHLSTRRTRSYESALNSDLLDKWKYASPPPSRTRSRLRSESRAKFRGTLLKIEET